MQLTDILTPQRIKIPLTAATKQGLIEELIDLLVANGDVADRQAAVASVLDRERTRTTGIGGGVALPHGKTGAVKGLVLAFGKTAGPVDFESVDDKPVTLVALLLGPSEMTGPHIQALARISRVLSLDASRRKIEEATTPAQLLKAVADVEKQDG